MSQGWNLRLEVLRRAAETEILDPLRTHGWTASIEQEVEQGEYLLIAAERGTEQAAVAVPVVQLSLGPRPAVAKKLQHGVDHRHRGKLRIGCVERHGALSMIVRGILSHGVVTASAAW